MRLLLNWVLSALAVWIVAHLGLGISVSGPVAALIAALVIGFIAALFPARWSRRFWPGWVWVAPVLAMMACVYLTIPWFRQ